MNGYIYYVCLLKMDTLCSYYMQKKMCNGVQHIYDKEIDILRNFQNNVNDMCTKYAIMKYSHYYNMIEKMLRLEIWHVTTWNVKSVQDILNKKYENNKKKYNKMSSSRIKKFNKFLREFDVLIIPFTKEYERLCYYDEIKFKLGV